MESRPPAVRADYLVKPCTAFAGTQLLAAGPLIEVVLAVKNAIEGGSLAPVLIFDDTTGRAVDFDLRGFGIRIFRLHDAPVRACIADPR